MGYVNNTLVHRESSLAADIQLCVELGDIMISGIHDIVELLVS